ncbi:MAG: hypothetical protein AAGE94_04990 [Acidobacteriota bacterium]
MWIFQTRTTPRGFLAVMSAPIVGFFAAQLAVDALLGSGTFNAEGSRYVGYAWLIGGGYLIALGLWLNREDHLIASDDEDRYYIVGGFRNGPRFISLPIELWGILLIALGVYSLYEFGGGG